MPTQLQIRFYHDLCAPCTSDGSPVTAAAAGSPCLCAAAPAIALHGTGIPLVRALGAFLPVADHVASGSGRVCAGHAPAVRRESRIVIAKPQTEDDAVGMATTAGVPKLDAGEARALPQARATAAPPPHSNLVPTHISQPCTTNPCLLSASKRRGKMTNPSGGGFSRQRETDPTGLLPLWRFAFEPCEPPHQNPPARIVSPAMRPRVCILLPHGMRVRRAHG
jgi:hypothetical protein